MKSKNVDSSLAKIIIFTRNSIGPVFWDLQEFENLAAIKYKTSLLHISKFRPMYNIISNESTEVRSPNGKPKVNDLVELTVPAKFFSFAHHQGHKDVFLPYVECF